MIQIAVFAAARREMLTARTCALLDSHGGARALACPKTLFYSAPSNFDAPKLPPLWRLVRRRGPFPGGLDYAWMCRTFPEGSDALVFEDDVYPATNAVCTMSRHHVPAGCAFTSFYDFHNLTEGQPIVVGPGEMMGAQAILIPWRTLEAMRSGRKPFYPPSGGQETWLNRIAAILGQSIEITPSLVQHVGTTSLYAPGATLTGERAPSTSFPEAFELPQFGDLWCSFHGSYHKDGQTCPLIERE